VHKKLNCCVRTGVVKGCECGSHGLGRGCGGGVSGWESAKCSTGMGNRVCGGVTGVWGMGQRVWKRGSGQVVGKWVVGGVVTGLGSHRVDRTGMGVGGVPGGKGREWEGKGTGYGGVGKGRKGTGYGGLRGRCVGIVTGHGNGCGRGKRNAKGVGREWVRIGGCGCIGARSEWGLWGRVAGEVRVQRV
jgi:hypothetical protein